MAGVKIRKGDTVQVISGKDKGTTGRVLVVDPETQRVIVEGVNFVTKHTKIGQTQRGTQTGGMETFESPIHISNVALVDPKTKKPTRVGFRVEKNAEGKTVRVRFSKSSGEDL